MTVQKDLGERISNIVMMGMGEPLDNFENVLKFLENVNNPRLHKLIYLATGIEKLTEDEKKEKFNLTKEIQDLVFDKNIDLEDIKDNFNVNSLSDLTLAQARKLYGELNG